MHINPPDWPQVTKEQWDTLLKDINWIRDGYGGGIWYKFRDGRGKFGFEGDDEKYYVDERFFLNMGRD